jgi:hypothetical protein
VYISNTILNVSLITLLQRRNCCCFENTIASGAIWLLESVRHAPYWIVCLCLSLLNCYLFQASINFSPLNSACKFLFREPSRNHTIQIPRFGTDAMPSNSLLSLSRGNRDRRLKSFKLLWPIKWWILCSIHPRWLSYANYYPWKPEWLHTS